MHMQKSLSIIIPLYNEESVVGALCEKLREFRTFAGVIVSEILLIDDGSHDTTLARIREESKNDPQIKIIALSRNFGHQIAVTAGLDASSGDAVVIMDGDLQDPPEIIEALVTKWNEGYEVVYAVRTARLQESYFKKVTARLFYRIVNHLAEIDIPVDSGDFSLLDRKVVEVLKKMPEHDRFLRGLRVWAGYRATGVSYERVARVAGETKYSFKKMLNLAFAGIFGFSTAPLRFATYLGLLVAGMSFLFGAYIVIARFVFNTAAFVSGWASLIVSVFFVGGIQLFIMGILGEYIGMIYTESKHRPLYVIKERIGFE